MSLEGDMLLPPKGPARWGWTQRIMKKIAVARGVISPDESIVITPRTGGITISRPRPPALADLPTDPFQCSVKAGNLLITGGGVRINGTFIVSMEDAVKPLSLGKHVCIKLPLDLTPTGDALTPRHWEQYTWSTDIGLTFNPTFELITTAALEGAGYPVPGIVGAADVYIPIAWIDNGFRVRQWWHGYLFDLNVNLYHGFFAVTTA